MQPSVPEQLLIVAGRGVYPQLLLTGARKAGVRRIALVAIRGMTSRRVAALADASAWFGVGELASMLDWMRKTGIRQVAAGGQITPGAIFRTRFDSLSRALLRGIPFKNAHTVFSAVARLFSEHGIETIPASAFMEDHLPPPGVLTRRAPDEREQSDIRTGHAIAMAVCNNDIGQTVVLKDGMILAVEAFDGTNRTILRGGKLGGRGVVVVKVAKNNHDMRFDIPVVGAQTIAVLRKARVSALAFQAGRTILLEREETLATANRHDIAIVSLDSGLPSAPVRLDREP